MAKKMNSPYNKSPACILTQIIDDSPNAQSYCAGFEYSIWRCDGFADNLVEWIVDYALKSEELETLNHTNPYTRLRQAAVRIYTSEKYQNRGEIGEITAHAVCRRYFQTIPIAPRVNYLSASNDPVKAFDLVHVRYTETEDVELWLGEAKFYKDRNDAVREAINSIASHIEQGFLNNEKFLLGPQVSNDIPHSGKVKALLSSETSLDMLISHAVFPVLIAANSDAITNHRNSTPEYLADVQVELDALWQKLSASEVSAKVSLFLIYVPLGNKDELAKAFDARLKGLQIGGG